MVEKDGVVQKTLNRNQDGSLNPCSVGGQCNKRRCSFEWHKGQAPVDLSNESGLFIDQFLFRSTGDRVKCRSDFSDCVDFPVPFEICLSRRKILFRLDARYSNLQKKKAKTGWKMRADSTNIRCPCCKYIYPETNPGERIKNLIVKQQNRIENLRKRWTNWILLETVVWAKIKIKKVVLLLVSNFTNPHDSGCVSVAASPSLLSPTTDITEGLSI